jgi:hypothetical protein
MLKAKNETYRINNSTGLGLGLNNSLVLDFNNDLVMQNNYLINNVKNKINNGFNSILDYSGPVITQGPTQSPTQIPTQGPTQTPIITQTQWPTQGPIITQTQGPTQVPTQGPLTQTQGPTQTPTQTQGPVNNPIVLPSTLAPVTQPPISPLDAYMNTRNVFTMTLGSTNVSPDGTFYLLSFNINSVTGKTYANYVSGSGPSGSTGYFQVLYTKIFRVALITDQSDGITFDNTLSGSIKPSTVNTMTGSTGSIGSIVTTSMLISPSDQIIFRSSTNKINSTKFTFVIFPVLDSTIASILYTSDGTSNYSANKSKDPTVLTTDNFNISYTLIGSGGGSGIGFDTDQNYTYGATGGGGAGQFITGTTKISLTEGQTMPFSINIGPGGQPGTNGSGTTLTGPASSFGTITAIGGGAGGSGPFVNNGTVPSSGSLNLSFAGASGGNGGGGSARRNPDTNNNAPGGSGDHIGGAGSPLRYTAGGGAGACGNGQDGLDTVDSQGHRGGGGAGGPGCTDPITGLTIGNGGGGAGQWYGGSQSNAPGSGGLGAVGNSRGSPGVPGFVSLLVPNVYIQSITGGSLMSTDSNGLTKIVFSTTGSNSLVLTKVRTTQDSPEVINTYISPLSVTNYPVVPNNPGTKVSDYSFNVLVSGIYFINYSVSTYVSVIVNGSTITTGTFYYFNSGDSVLMRITSTLPVNIVTGAISYYQFSVSKVPDDYDYLVNLSTSLPIPQVITSGGNSNPYATTGTCSIM